MDIYGYNCPYTSIYIYWICDILIIELVYMYNKKHKMSILDRFRKRREQDRRKSIKWPWMKKKRRRYEKEQKLKELRGEVKQNDFNWMDPGAMTETKKEEKKRKRRKIKILDQEKIGCIYYEY